MYQQYQQQYQPQMYSPSSPPILYSGISPNPQMEQFNAMYTSAVVNDMITHSGMNALRQAAVQWFGQNNWNNRQFAEHMRFVLHLGHVEAVSTNQNPSVVMANVVALANRAVLGVVFANIGNQIQLTPQQVQEAQSLLMHYNQLTQHAFRPNQAGAQAGVSAYQPMATQAANMTGYAGNSSNAAWKQATPTTSNTGLYTQPSVEPQPSSQEQFQWKGNTHTSAKVETKAETVVEPLITTETKQEVVEDNYWKGSLEQRFPLAFDPRRFQRSVHRTQDGGMKEEFIEVDYDEHALQTPYTHAEFEFQRAQLEMERNRPIEDHEVKEVVHRVVPTPVEFKEAVVVPTSDYCTGVESLLHWTEYLKFSCMAANKLDQQPEVIHASFNQPLIQLTLPSEKARYDTFLEKLSRADTWEGAAKVLRESTNVGAAFWSRVNRLFTDEMNLFLKCRLGVFDIEISDFSSDMPDLAQIFLDEMGDLLFGALTGKRKYPGNKLVRVVKDAIAESIEAAVFPYESSPVTKDNIVGLCSHNSVTIVDYNSFDFEFALEVNEAKAINYSVSRKMRSLMDEVFEKSNESTYHHYIVTKDQVIYMVFKSAIDDENRILYRVI